MFCNLRLIHDFLFGSLLLLKWVWYTSNGFKSTFILSQNSIVLNQTYKMPNKPLKFRYKNLLYKSNETNNIITHICKNSSKKIFQLVKKLCEYVYCRIFRFRTT